MLPRNKLLYLNQNLKAESSFLIKTTFFCKTKKYDNSYKDYLNNMLEAFFINFHLINANIISISAKAFIFSDRNEA